MVKGMNRDKFVKELEIGKFIEKHKKYKRYFYLYQAVKDHIRRGQTIREILSLCDFLKLPKEVKEIAGREGKAFDGLKRKYKEKEGSVEIPNSSEYTEDGVDIVVRLIGKQKTCIKRYIVTSSEDKKKYINCDYKIIVTKGKIGVENLKEKHLETIN